MLPTWRQSEAVSWEVGRSGGRRNKGRHPAGGSRYRHAQASCSLPRRLPLFCLCLLPVACGILVPGPGIEPVSPVV